MTASAVDFIFSLERFGMKFGLDSMRLLCEALGHPERAFTSVHVAGTNGKGSVAAMVDSILRAAGHATARYTSPHLVRIEERFVIDGVEVDRDRLEAAAARVKAIVEGFVSSGRLEAPPTFFECTTAIAFDLFRAAGVELAVIEVGLGGRLDATNVVEPAATAIVSIDFDHQTQLGSTLASIAREKAGIAKPGVPMICGPLPDAARTVIADVCAEVGAPLVRADTPSMQARVARMPLGLPGAHQIDNAAVAVALVETLDARGVGIGSDAIARGLAEVRWPGRLERFDVAGRTVIVDAAHNPAGARALAKYLTATVREPVTLLFGAMRDKAVAEMAGILAPAAAEIIVTTAPSPRAMAAPDIAAIARGTHPRITAIADPFEALRAALDRGRTVVVAGSIFLIGPLRERIGRGILR
ncbi:MAG TPA: folylpolyglutamate synthase/dihydrofolate synthase family protein [Vicinamibacterales bacterium]|nr:folylpolyglutamate synthase/dihydrofolate synthase family protein [Vicinamibacterales bacterium]